MHPAEASRKQQIVRELQKLVAIFLYLAAFFCVLRIYTHLILLEHQISSIVFGLIFLKALVLAKIILTGEALRLGESFYDRPLIIPTLYKTLLFCILAVLFEVVEHLILGRVQGKTLGESVAEILAKGWPHLVCRTMVVFLAFLPFFAFRTLEHTLGEGKLLELFFQTGEKKTGEDEAAATPRTGKP